MDHAAGKFAVRGQTLAFRGDPFLVAPEDAVAFDSDGAVVVENGTIAETGPAGEILAKHPGIAVEHYAQDLIMAGFVDCHVHYPQCEVIASYGEQLLEWLNRYTFPAEQKFADPDYARGVAEHFLDEALRNGTTTASVYCTVHPESVDAFFAAAELRGLRMAAGKMMMDRNAPRALLDTAQTGYDQSKALIARWHGRSRLTYVVSPRFAPTSTPEQLEAAGTLWREHPDALVQTHLSENPREIAWVRSLYPDAPDYFGVYERYGLTGRGSNFGHAVHLTDRERAAFRATGSGISHCPTSNAFLGSGLFDMKGLREGRSDVPVGLATDIGGGSSLSMFQTMRSSYEICRLAGYSLHPAKAYYLATVGSATVMHLADRIGNLLPGHEADFIVIDLRSRPQIARRMDTAADLWEMLFVQMIMADDRAIRATYAGGRKVYARSG
jgi:guanine deaminase